MKVAARCAAGIVGALISGGIALSVAVNTPSLQTTTWKIVSAIIAMVAITGALWFVAGLRDELRTSRSRRMHSS